MCEDQCENCKHYVAISNDAGECHRNPPVCRAAIIGDHCVEKDAFNGIWPNVPTVGRCGEFEHAVAVRLRV